MTQVNHPFSKTKKEPNKIIGYFIEKGPLTLNQVEVDSISRTWVTIQGRKFNKDSEQFLYADTWEEAADHLKRITKKQLKDARAKVSELEKKQSRVLALIKAGNPNY